MEVIATFAEHPNSCVLLLGGLFGPTRSAYRAAHLEIEMPGTGEEIVSVLHVDDGVRAISKVLEVGASGVINVVAPIEVRWRDVMPRARWMGGKSPYSNAVIESRILPTIGFEFEQKVLE